MAAHAPTRKKATNTKTKKKTQKTYRDANGVSNIEKYNARKKAEAVKKDPRDLPCNKTVGDWADMVQERDNERQKRIKAENALSAQVDRAL